MAKVVLALALLALGCAARVRADASAPSTEAKRDATVAWSEVWPELESHICMRTFEVQGQSFDEPLFGPRANCVQPPPATALERAVERAWKDAMPMLASMRHETVDELRAMLATTTGDARLVEARRIYLSERFVGLLLAHLEPALAEQRLACVDCPAPYLPQPRSIAWAELTPYLAGYVWPEPVVTPRDAAGKPTGAPPKYGLKVCIGAQGIDELETQDPALLELGFLATLHNGRLVDRAGELYRTMLEDPAYARLSDDFLRTRWLRDELGPRLLAEPAVRVATCETIERFVGDTGISVAECRGWLAARASP